MSHPNRPDQQPPPMGPSAAAVGQQGASQPQQASPHAYDAQPYGVQQQHGPGAQQRNPYAGGAQPQQAQQHSGYGPPAVGYGPQPAAWGTPAQPPHYQGWSPHMAPTPSFTLASPGARLAGALVDGFIFGVVAVSFALFYGIMMGASGSVETSEAFEVAALAWLAFAVFAYWLVNAYLIATRGQSLGKMAVGTRIIKTDGSPCGFTHGFLIRSMGFGFVTAIPVLGAFIALANIFFVFSEDHRMLHDRLASTVVVKV